MWRNKHKHPALKLPPTWDLGDLMPELENEIQAVHRTVRSSKSPESDPKITAAFDALREAFDARCDDFLYVAGEQGKQLATLQAEPSAEALLRTYADYNTLRHEFSRVQIFVSLLESEYYSLPASRAFNEHAVDKTHLVGRQFSEIWDNIALDEGRIAALTQEDPHIGNLAPLLRPAPERPPHVPLSEQRATREAQDVRLADYRHLYARMMTEKQDAPLEEQAALATKMLNALAYQQGKLANPQSYANPSISTNREKLDAYLDNIAAMREKCTPHMAAIRTAGSESAPPQYTWEEAVDIVITAFGKFHPEMGEIARDALIDGWVHAAHTPEKFHNGFNQGSLKSVIHPANHPYILMNFDGSQHSLNTLAHELGHGISTLLEGEKRYLRNTNPALNESFAHFAATLAIDEAIERAPTPKARIARIKAAAELSYQFAANDSQVRFEHGLYTQAAAQDYAPMDTAQIAGIARRALHQPPPPEGLPEEQKRHADAQSVLNFARIMHFTNQPSYYVLSYPLAELGAVQFAETLHQATPEERHNLAERWLGVMRWEGVDRQHDYETGFGAVGVPTDPASVVQGMETRLARLHGMLEKEQEKVAPQRDRPSFVERLRQQRQQQPALQNGIPR